MDTTFPNFKDLQTSTSTVMIYTNVEFCMSKMFHSIALSQPSEIVYTKKQKNIDKKKITANIGDIINVQYAGFIRGMIVKKKKKTWCVMCRPMYKTVSGDEKKINTLIDAYIPIKGTDVYELGYSCGKCNKVYKANEIRKINHFLNQVSFIISIGKSPMLNVMIFKDSIKIAGCKSNNDVKDILQIFWNRYLKDTDFYTMKCENENVSFCIETVMTNVKFNVGYNIVRGELSKVINNPLYSDIVCISEYESTKNSSVEISMYQKKPENFMYILCRMKPDGNMVVEHVDHVEFKKKNKKEPMITFLVFSSGQCILSGKYVSEMERVYAFFADVVQKNRTVVEEKIISTTGIDFQIPDDTSSESSDDVVMETYHDDTLF